MFGFQKIDDSTDLPNWELTIDKAVQSPHENLSVHKLTERCYRYINEKIFVQRGDGESDQEYETALTEKRQEYIDEVYKYMESIEPNWKRAVIQKENALFGKPRVNNTELIPPGEIEEFELEEIPVLTDKTTGHAIDVVQFIFKKDINPKKKDMMIQEIKNQWSFFRDKTTYPEGFELPFVFVSTSSRDRVARSCCHAGIGKNPSVLVDEGYNHDAKGMTIHEMIHALFFTQNNNEVIVNGDFIEGIATFFSDIQLNVAGGPNSLLGVTEFNKWALKAANLQTGQLIGSHTQLLKRAVNRGRYQMEVDQREYTYMVGHAIVQSIFESPRFKQSMLDASKTGRSPYKMFIEMHGKFSRSSLYRIFGVDASTYEQRVKDGKISFRSTMDAVLKDSGFTDKEVLSIKTNANNILKEVGRTI